MVLHKSVTESVILRYDWTNLYPTVNAWYAEEEEEEGCHSIRIGLQSVILNYDRFILR